MKVGDLALVIGSKFYPERVGQVCQIVEPYALRPCRMPSGEVRQMLRYVVSFPDVGRTAFSYRNLMPLSGDQSFDTASERLPLTVGSAP